MTIVHRPAAAIAAIVSTLALLVVSGGVGALPIASPPPSPPAIEGLIVDEATLARALAATALDARNEPSTFSAASAQTSPPLASPPLAPPPLLLLTPSNLLPNFPWPYVS